MEKYKSKEKEWESQIKTLKEDLSRKRELISSLKATQENTQKEIIERGAKNESKKKILRKSEEFQKEINRKDCIIKELKSQYDEYKLKELNFQSELKPLQLKIKSLKSDLLRKEKLLKETKEKFETEMIKIKENEVKTIEISKHKEIMKKYKQDLERKEFKISNLESKLETNASELEKIKNESILENNIVKSESVKENKKIANIQRKLKKMEEAARTGTIVIRSIINEMVLTVEKLRSDLVINQNNSNRGQPEESKISDIANLQNNEQSIDLIKNSLIQDSIQE